MAAERTSEETKTTLFQVMANIKPGGQKWSVKNSYPARRTALENVKDAIRFGILTVFSDILQLFLLHGHSY